MTLFSLSRKVGKTLKGERQTLVTAESCTGGWVAEAVTSVPGSSDWFERGYVTYSNAAKRELLGVTAGTLNKHGAVSEETARAMAKGALRRGRGTIAVAITGIAGPGGGSPGKPVGTVCFAWARAGARGHAERKMRSEMKRFKGNRQSVRRQSVVHALKGVLRCL